MGHDSEYHEVLPLLVSRNHAIFTALAIANILLLRVSEYVVCSQDVQYLVMLYLYNTNNLQIDFELQFYSEVFIKLSLDIAMYQFSLKHLKK